MTNKTTDTAKDADPVENSEQTTESTLIDDTIISAGSLTRRLRECREQANMDIRQAAQEMHLPLGVLKALEDENFTDLPEPPYVRGYLRSYARLNESDPNELVRRYEVLRGADPDDVASFSPSMPLKRVATKPSVSPSTVKLAGLALIVLLLGVLSMIPAVSQWVSNTWTSFSADTRTAEEMAPDAQIDQKIIGEIERENAAKNAANTADDQSDDQNKPGEATSKNDTATGTTNSEQLALDTTQQNTGNTAPANATDSDNAQQAATANDQTEDSAAQENTAAEGTPAQQASDEASDPAAAQADNNTTATDSSESSTATTEPNAGDDTPTDAPAGAQSADADSTQSSEQPAEETAGNTASDAATAQQTAADPTQAQQTANADGATPAQQAQSSTDNFKQPIDGNVQIRLDFTQSCWMSIKDGQGKTIFSSLSAAGMRKEMRARTPLKFKVGNAAGVKIYLNGQLINQAPYTRGNVATFEVQ